MYNSSSVPTFFLVGDRFLQIHHARIRNKCSNLNHDLVNNHFRENQACRCGSICEDADHFFFRCQLYTNQRLQLFNNTRQYHPLSCQKLLFGINNLTDEDNSDLFKNVQQYIKQTRRFETPNE